MDLAYDYIQDDVHPKDQGDASSSSNSGYQPTLNDDIQDAYKTISSSSWGIKIGGFMGNVIKQGESVYNQAQKELAEVGEDATKGLTDLCESIINRTRYLTQNTIQVPDDDSQSTPTRSNALPSEDAAQQPESVLAHLRVEASKRLKDLQRAEDAADEALLRFEGNVGNFLRNAISIAPPEDTAQGGTVLFEGKDAQGRRVIHTSRFDAQLHVIHTSPDRFTKDPSGAEFESWATSFDIGERTDDIITDLAKYSELRSTMEQLVSDQIPYADFWKRYYFLRHGIETAESRRCDLLKAASAEDEVGWDDDSDDEAVPKEASKDKDKEASATSTTLQPQGKIPPKPAESRKSNEEKSVADSEAIYDVVGAASGKTSQAPNSPKEGKKAEDSDDWE